MSVWRSDLRSIFLPLDKFSRKMFSGKRIDDGASVPGDKIQDDAVEKLRLFPIGRMPGFGDKADLAVWDTRGKHAYDRGRAVEIGIAGQEQNRRLQLCQLGPIDH